MSKKFKANFVQISNEYDGLMGELRYLLGLQGKQTGGDIFINQTKYTTNFLKSVNMQDSATTSTLMTTATKLDLNYGESVDITNYKGIIGSILYFTASRPNIMYATFLCAIFQVDPKEPHQ